MCYMNTLLQRGIRLLVCDMAGTVIQENGAVYKAIATSLQRSGCKITQEQISQWYGRSKNEVINEVLNDQFTPILAFDKYEETMNYFNRDLHMQYFEYGSIGLIDNDIPTFFNKLRNNGIKIGLNTGYSKPMQQEILNSLQLDTCIDYYISSDDVSRGRPYPYMIHRLMEEAGLEDVKMIAKAGDTVIDMCEGKNAGCGLTIGVLSGATSRKNLKNSNTADIIVDKLTDLK